MQVQGAFNELMTSNLILLTKTSEEESEEEGENEDELSSINTEKQGESLVLNKNKWLENVEEIGRVKWRSYYTYCTAGAGFWGIFISVFLFVGAQALIIIANVWVSLW